MTTFQLIDELLKQREIKPSHMMSELGFSSGLYSQWKKGNQRPSADKLTKISEYLNVPLDVMLKPNGVSLFNGKVCVSRDSSVLSQIEKRRLEEEHQESERIKKSIIETLDQMSAENLRKAEQIVKVINN